MQPSVRRAAHAALVVGALGVSSACATHGARFTFYEENDALSLRGRSDQHYTQGARATWVVPTETCPTALRELAGQLPHGDVPATEAIGVVLGQSIYTPENIERRRVVRDDRPYAGWLFVGLVVQETECLDDDPQGDVADSVEVDVGVVGPASLADDTQTRFHRLINGDTPHGWHNQLENEPGLLARYERRVRLLAGDAPLGLGWDALGSYGGALGNVATHGEVGGLFRFGYAIPRDFGVNTMNRTVLDFAGPSNGPAVFLFAGGLGRVVGWNVFLDGNTFRDSHEVDKEYLVGELLAGIGFQWGAWRLTYSQVVRSREFREQDHAQNYASVSVSFALDF